MPHDYEPIVDQIRRIVEADNYGDLPYIVQGLLTMRAIADDLRTLLDCDYSEIVQKVRTMRAEHNGSRAYVNVINNELEKARTAYAELVQELCIQTETVEILLAQLSKQRAAYDALFVQAHALNEKDAHD